MSINGLEPNEVPTEAQLRSALKEIHSPPTNPSKEIEDLVWGRVLDRAGKQSHETRETPEQDPKRPILPPRRFWMFSAAGAAAAALVAMGVLMYPLNNPNVACKRAAKSKPAACEEPEPKALPSQENAQARPRDLLPVPRFRLDPTDTPSEASPEPLHNDSADDAAPAFGEANASEDLKELAETHHALPADPPKAIGTFGRPSDTRKRVVKPHKVVEKPSSDSATAIDAVLENKYGPSTARTKAPATPPESTTPRFETEEDLRDVRLGGTGSVAAIGLERKADPSRVAPRKIAKEAKPTRRFGGGEIEVAKEEPTKRKIPHAALEVEAPKDVKTPAGIRVSSPRYEVVDVKGKRYVLDNRSGELRIIGEKSRPAPHDPYANLRLPKPNVPVLKGGVQDDNRDFGSFLAFLKRTPAPEAIKMDLAERVVIDVTDRDGLPLTNADVRIYDGNRMIHKARTYSDGRTLLHPGVVGVSQGTQAFRVQVLPPPGARSSDKTQGRMYHGRQGTWRIRTPYSRPQNQVKVDIMLCLDCTGSMADEIERIQKTLMAMTAKLNVLPGKPRIRWGLVQYRDRGDTYVTKSHGFTTDVDKFQRRLNQCAASGGGDYMESVNEALHKAVEKADWDKKDTIRLAFLIGDAPPHMDYGNDVKYVETMKKAQRRAIKIYPLAASGLDKTGEVIFRQVAQYTMARFLFISYNKGGQPTTPHAVGNPGQSNNLDDLIVRIVVDEINVRSQKRPHIQKPSVIDREMWE